MPDGMLVFDDSGDATLVFPDATAMDSASGDGGTMDASEDAGDTGVNFFDVRVESAVTGTLDVVEPDVVLPAQPCAWTARTVAFGAGGSGDRNVFVSSDMTGFAAGASVVRDGANNVWVQRVNRDGAATITGNFSAAPMGSTVRGGAFLRDGMFILAPWSQTEGSNENIYLKRAQDNYIEVAGSRAAVTTSGIHQEPQVLLLRTSLMLVWRTIESGRGRVRVAPLSGSTVGTAVNVTEASEDVGSFRAFASQSAGVYGVAYRDNANNAIRVRTFDAMGATTGAATDVASGADLGATVDAVIEDDGDTWVTWAQPATGGTVRLRRMGLGTGAGTAAATSIATPAGARDPGISLDGTNLAIAYRDLGAAMPTISLLRLNSDGTLIDRSQLGGATTGGRVGLEARSGRYGIGWSDDYASGAVVRVGVASCR